MLEKWLHIFPCHRLGCTFYVLWVLESFVGLEVSHQSHDFLVVPDISQPSTQSLAAFHLIKMQSYWKDTSMSVEIYDKS